MHYAQKFLQEPFTDFIKSSPIAKLCLLTVLFDVGKFEQVVATWKTLPKVKNVAQSTIVMASLYQIGTEDSYKEALQMIHDHDRDYPSGPGRLSTRGIQIFSLFAIRQKDFQKAHQDRLEKQEYSNIRMNLLIYGLVKSGNVAEAVDELNYCITDFFYQPVSPEFKFILSSEVMKELEEAVKKTQSVDKLRLFQQLVKRIMESDCAVVEDISLDGMTLQPISSSPNSAFQDKEFGVHQSGKKIKSKRWGKPVSPSRNK